MTSAERNSESGRRPSFPKMDLHKAVEKAAQLFSAIGSEAVEDADVFRAWGCETTDRDSSARLADLHRFGLVRFEGVGVARRIRLSELALEIVSTGKMGSTETKSAIQNAALKPPLYKDLWQNHRPLLSEDQKVVGLLTSDFGFSEKRVREFIGPFKSSLEFAGLTEAHHGSESGAASSVGQFHSVPEEDQELENEDTFEVPLGGGKRVVFQVPRAFSEKDWELMFSILRAMKPGLVSSTDLEQRIPLREEIWAG